MRSSHPMAVNKLKNKAAMPPEQQRYPRTATIPRNSNDALDIVW